MHLWVARVWPVLTGAVVAVGVVVATSAFGPLMFLVVYAGLSLFAVVTVVGLSLETGIERSTALRIGLLSSLAVMVLAGLCQVHPNYGLLIGVMVGVTSPASLRLVARLRPRSGRRTTDVPAPGLLVDPVMLDRRFHDIVSRLRESGEFPEA